MIEPFPVTVSITLSKTLTIDAENPGYWEKDEDGNKFFVSTREPITEKDVRCLKFLPDDILRLIATDKMMFPSTFKEDCEGWIVDDLTIVEE